MYEDCHVIYEDDLDLLRFSSKWSQLVSDLQNMAAIPHRGSRAHSAKLLMAAVPLICRMAACTARFIVFTIGHTILCGSQQKR